MSLPTASEEQLDIIECVKNGLNVQVEAVAGSGKTTCMLHISRVSGSKHILILTYNARLKDETRAKIGMLGLTNVEAHSYHAFCVKYYSPACFTDKGILDVLQRDTPPSRDFWFDLIMVDEVQDMTPTYFKLLKKIIRDSRYGAEVDGVYVDNSELEYSPVGSEPTENVFSDEPDDVLQGTSRSAMVTHKNPKIQICLFGDTLQNIYAFKEADDRYLTLGDKIVRDGVRDDWIKMPLSQSFRITSEMAMFINVAVLGYNKITALKSGSPVKYVICNSMANGPFNEIRTLLRGGYKCGDIFIISASIRSKNKYNPVKVLENKLVKCGYQCYVPISDDELLKPDVISNKIVFSSIHQTKGLERKIVLFLTADISYFEFYQRDADRRVCPNTLYVAWTRASEKLIIIHGMNKNFLPFMNVDAIREVCDFRDDGLASEFVASTNPFNNFTATELTRHLTTEFIETIMGLIEYKTVAEPRANPIKMTSIISTGKGRETVYEINGTCIPTIYEYHIKRDSTVFNYVLSRVGQLPAEDRARIEPILSKYRLDRAHRGSGARQHKLTIPEFLYVCNAYHALESGLLFKLRQIQTYGWLDMASVSAAVDVISKYITRETDFEREYERSIVVDGVTKRVRGRIDAIGDGIVWEFKCVEKIKPEHIIQLVIYVWLQNNRKVRYRLLNALDGNVFEITNRAYDDVVGMLIAEKTKDNNRCTVAEFIAKNV